MKSPLLSLNKYRDDFRAELADSPPLLKYGGTALALTGLYMDPTVSQADKCTLTKTSVALVSAYLFKKAAARKSARNYLSDNSALIHARAQRVQTSQEVSQAYARWHS